MRWDTYLINKHVSLPHGFTGSQQDFGSEFSGELENTINMVLLAIQNLVKRREGEAKGEQNAGAKRGERLQPGRLPPTSSLFTVGELSLSLEEWGVYLPPGSEIIEIRTQTLVVMLWC